MTLNIYTPMCLTINPTEDTFRVTSLGLSYESRDEADQCLARFLDNLRAEGKEAIELLSDSFSNISKHLINLEHFYFVEESKISKKR